MEHVSISVETPAHGPMAYMHLSRGGVLILVTVVERPSGFSAMFAGGQDLPDVLLPLYATGLPSLKAVEEWMIKEAATGGVILSAMPDPGSFTAKMLFGE